MDLFLPEKPNTTESGSHNLSAALLCSAATENWSPWRDGKKITSREAIALYVLCKMATSHKKEPQAFCDWAAAYVIHLALLRRLPLAFRSLDELALEDENSMHRFLSEFSVACTGVIPHIPGELQWDCFDILDGRLLRFVVVKQLHLPKEIVLEVHLFAKEIHQTTDVNIEASLHSFCLAQVGAGAPTQPVVNLPSLSGYGILPFSQPTLDSFLQDVQVAHVAAQEKQSPPRIHKELSHWHNARVPVDVKRPQSRRTKWEARRNQIWLNAFMKYSESLTNAAGKMIDPEIIVVGEHHTERMSSSAIAQSTKPMKSSEAAKPDAKLDQSTGRNRKKPKELSGKEKALKEAEAIRRGRAAAKSNTALSSWEEQCKRLEEVPNLVTRYLETMKYLSGLRSETRLAIGSDISVYSCNILASMLLEAGHSGFKSLNPKEDARRLSALLWSEMVDLSKKQISPSSENLFNALADAIGFLAPAVRKNSTSLSRPLPYRSVLDRQVKSLNLPKASIDFQLRHCGPFLERSFDPAPDSRVPFHPDAWQRQVLDAIDADKSLFVVAPTSAGKTFISFYAMFV